LKENLFSIIRGNKDIIISAGVDICDALEAMQEKEIVHRDLKSNNVLVTSKGRAKVIDFGMAKRKDYDLAPPGIVFGTPEYMSPEQARGDATDQNSDLFSFALTLFRGLTGSLAYCALSVRANYIPRASQWNLANIESAKNSLRQVGMPESFTDAWSLAVQPDPPARQREPLKKELEAILKKTKYSR